MILKHGNDYMDKMMQTNPNDDNRINLPLNGKEACEAFLHVDNMAAVTVSKTGNFAQKLKHLQVRFYYLAQEVAAKRISIHHVPGKENPADLFTKAVSLATFESLVDKLVQ